MTGILCALVGMAKAPLSVTASDVTGDGAGFSASGFIISNTSPVTTPSGGTAPYTYAWAHVTTSSGSTPSILSSTDQDPTWNATVFAGTPSASTWRVTATDADGRTGNTTITVTLTWTDVS
jgi:hypothetical protein